MNDYENRLKDALTQATSDYRPADPHEAKQRFMKRFRRRRILLYSSSVALAGAAVAAIVLLVPAQITEREGALPPATVLERSISTIPVGDAPSGIAFGNEVVWVASSAEGRVERIGPLSNRVGRTYDVGGTPDDVAVGLGAAWVADADAGTVTRIEFGSKTGIPISVGEPGSGLDVAPGAGAVWVVSEPSGLFRIDPETEVVTPIDTGIEGPTDVAAGQGSVVVAGANELVMIDPETMQRTPLDVLDESSDRDLQMAEGAVWVADGEAGEVTRYDLVSGKSSEPVFVGGDFTAIASGEGAIWMITGNEGSSANLTRLDPVTGEILGGRVSIEGRPIDVTTGAGSVWVVSHDGDSVTRIDPNALPE